MVMVDCAQASIQEVYVFTVEVIGLIQGGVQGVHFAPYVLHSLIKCPIITNPSEKLRTTVIMKLRGCRREA